jgi:uncharacterized protein with HEPN domain
VVGEAAKNVLEKIRTKYAQVEWKEVVGFRNVLTHEVFGIDLEAVWDTIKKNIPALSANILRVFESEKKYE